MFFPYRDDNPRRHGPPLVTLAIIGISTLTYLLVQLPLGPYEGQAYALSFGFIPEFIGRLPMVTVLDELTEDQLVAILTETKSALTKQFQKLMALEGVELDFTKDALQELARQAISQGTGARALRGLLEKVMLDWMYDIPGTDDIASIKITRPAVTGKGRPVIRRRTKKAAA